MLKRSVTVLVVAGLAALAAAAPSGAAKPTGVCPPPFDPLTFAEALELAHETGAPGTDEELLAFLVRFDKNQDEVLCFQDLPDTPGIPPFAFNVIDNTASVPS
jgi:hypothetical protein